MNPLNRKTAGVETARPVRVLQFGEGNFLRAFVDWVIDILNEKTNFNGDVQIIQPLGNGMGEAINQQDGLYHVVLNGIRAGKEVSDTRLITCVRGVINPYANYREFLAAGENPALEFIFSNTTEAGIAFDARDNTNDSLPGSFPGKLTALLYHRFNFFGGRVPRRLHIIPCELIDNNGSKLKETVLQFARHWNLPEAFLQSVDHDLQFYNTLVDRIVPGFPRERIDEIQQQLGYADQLVVTAEPFHLWVIEGPPSLAEIFPAAAAGLDVLTVDDQQPYRTRKVRILNGAHTMMVPVGYLNGQRTVREAMEDAFTGTFIREAIRDEIVPTMDLPAPVLKQFADDVEERFINPFIRHELRSIALNAISKFKVRVLPSMLDFIDRKGYLPDRIVFSLACLIRFYKGQWNNDATPVQDADDICSFFREVWTSADYDEVAGLVLGNAAFWDQDLRTVSGLQAQVSSFLEALETRGVQSAWEHHLQQIK